MNQWRVKGGTKLSEFRLGFAFEGDTLGGFCTLMKAKGLFIVSNCSKTKDEHVCAMWVTAGVRLPSCLRSSRRRPLRIAVQSSVTVEVNAGWRGGNLADTSYGNKSVTLVKRWFTA